MAGFNTFDGQTALERNAYGSISGEEILVETEKVKGVETGREDLNNDSFGGTGG